MSEDNKQEPKAPEPGTDEYDQQMAQRFEDSQNPDKVVTDARPDTLVPQMPDGGVEKFYNAETGVYDWQSHAKEAEYAVEQKRAAAEKKAGEDGQSDDDSGDEAPSDEAPSDDQVKDVVEAAGLKVEDLKQQIIENGELDASAKEALVKNGIPEALVDDYVALAQDKLQSNTHAAFEYVGGEEVWSQMSAWALENLPEAEIAKHNEMLAGDDWKVAMDILKQKMGAASPTAGEGDLVSSDSTGAPGSVGFKSIAEQTAAINDPRYRTDPTYRQQVQQRIGVSDYSRQYVG